MAIGPAFFAEQLGISHAISHYFRPFLGLPFAGFAFVMSLDGLRVILLPVEMLLAMRHAPSGVKYFRA